MAAAAATAAEGGGPGGQPPIPDIDEIVRKGQEQLRILMGGGRTGGGRGGPQGAGGGFGKRGLFAGRAPALRRRSGCSCRSTPCAPKSSRSS